MEFRTREGEQRYDAVVAAASETVVGLDFDGVLSPIVADPAAAVIHPDGPRTLIDLAPQVRAVAVITGRPARQAVTLGNLDEVADALPEGARLYVLGQYGNERWDSAGREFTSPPVPEGLDHFLDELPSLLLEHRAGEAFVEHKGIAVAVHTRRLPDPQAAFERLFPVLSAAAARHGLGVEPGKLVIEVRAAGMDKGEAVRLIRDELGADGFVFAGDDLGDLEAFRAVDALREVGSPGLLVCSGSEEQRALVELSDIVVDGPAGVLALLRQLARDAAARAG
ncbi:MAG TPA: trehalose-phosphatase [Nocardioidaceae bacterium]|nr:trehalose-phosphatase [Nocardioidaceae bacterium]